jgi:hypothetical protein
LPTVIKSSGLNRYDASFQEFIQNSSQFNYTQRLGTEEEVAAGILFLLSPAANFITGETMRIDGAEPLYNGIQPPIPHSNLPPFQDSKSIRHQDGSNVSSFIVTKNTESVLNHASGIASKL